jgi:hypothetical protein
MRFSIVIPCYNAERWLAGAIRSCLDQTARDLEVIVVDDGSSDGSRAIAEAAARSDARVRVICQDNQGVGAARNAGLALASGAYVNFLDADDLLAPEKLALQGAVLDDNPRIDCVLCDGSGIDADGREVMTHLVDPRRLAGPASMFDLFFSGGQFPPLIPLLRRRVAIDAGGFDTDRRVAGWADTAFWMQVGLTGATQHFIDRPLCQYRMHAASMSANHEAMDDAAARVYARMLRERPDESARALRLLQGRLADNEAALAGLRACVAGLEGELREMADQWRITRETLHADRQQLRDAHERLNHLRATTARQRGANANGDQRERSGHRMQRVVIFDAGETGRRLWEALATRASVEIVAFVDPDVRRHERAFLGTPVHPVEWLRDAAWDLVAVSGADTHAWRFPLAAAGVGSRRIVECRCLPRRSRRRDVPGPDGRRDRRGGRRSGTPHWHLRHRRGRHEGVGSARRHRLGGRRVVRGQQSATAGTRSAGPRGHRAGGHSRPPVRRGRHRQHEPRSDPQAATGPVRFAVGHPHA